MDPCSTLVHIGMSARYQESQGGPGCLGGASDFHTKEIGGVGHESEATGVFCLPLSPLSDVLHFPPRSPLACFFHKKKRKITHLSIMFVGQLRFFFVCMCCSCSNEEKKNISHTRAKKKK